MQLIQLHRERTVHKDNSGEQYRASPPQAYGMTLSGYPVIRNKSPSMQHNPVLSELGVSLCMFPESFREHHPSQCSRNSGFPGQICSEQASSLGFRPQDTMVLMYLKNRGPQREVFHIAPALDGAQHSGALPSKEQN